MDAALEARHPGYQSDQLPEPMKEAIAFCTRHSEDYVATSRSETLRSLVEEAKALAEGEVKFKSTMSERRRTVLSKKRLLLFKSLLERAESPDLNLVNDIAEGSI